MIHADALSHRLRAVILALVERRAIEVADPRVLGRIKDLMEDMPRRPAHPATREPSHQLLIRHAEVEHRAQPGAPLCQNGIQRLGLRRRAREAIQDGPLRTIRATQPLADHAHGDIVRNQLTFC